MIQKQKGTSDIYGTTAKKWQYINRIIADTAKVYNYNYIRTPIFEASELFKRSVGDGSDIVTKETYDFVDRGNRNITLRPEGTAGIVRAYIENKMYGDTSQPVKVYYNGPMYRYERPQAGRQREFTQFGAELIGSDDAIADAEIISLAVNIFKLLGLKDIEVQINTLGDQESRDNYKQALKEYFKLHLDDLCDDCKNRYINNPLRILDCKVDCDKEYFKNAVKTIDYLNEESKLRFEKVLEYLDLLEIKYVINTNIVRGLDYYTHTVFEIVEKNANMGSQNVIGAGGRYNGLIEQLDGKSTPAIGFASGIDRVLLALEKENITLPIDESIDLYILYANEDEKKYALYLTQQLRMNGFSVDTDYLNRSLKAQFRQADRDNAKYTIVLNSNQLENNELTIKNSKTKKEDIISLDAIIYYLDENIIDEEMSDIDENYV